MTDVEFDDQAAAIAAQLRDLADRGTVAPHERFAVCCRGSANPAALAWLAEGVVLERGATVVDLGAGLGGASQWFGARYGCQVVALEPAPRAARAAASLFPLTVVNASSDAVPFRSDAFDAAMLLGVISVVDDAKGVLREARRVARRIGVLDYCATRDPEVRAGGSRFVAPDALGELLAASGWTVEQSSAMQIPSPRTWSDAVARIDVRSAKSEREVAAAVDDGSIAPHALVAAR